MPDGMPPARGWWLLAISACIWLGVIGLFRLMWEWGGAFLFIPWTFFVVPSAMLAAAVVEVLIVWRARGTTRIGVLVQGGVRAVLYVALALVAANMDWYPFWFGYLFGFPTR